MGEGAVSVMVGTEGAAAAGSGGEADLRGSELAFRVLRVVLGVVVSPVFLADWAALPFVDFLARGVASSSSAARSLRFSRVDRRGVGAGGGVGDRSDGCSDCRLDIPEAWLAVSVLSSMDALRLLDGW